MTDAQKNTLELKLTDLQNTLTTQVTDYNRNLQELTTVSVADPLDVATTNTLKSNLQKLKEADNTTLNKVRHALTKLERGVYGDCVACNDEIDFKRLESQPFTLFCLECQEESEKHHRTHRTPVVQYYRNEAEELADLNQEAENE